MRVASVLLVAGVVVISLIASANCSGMCISELRYLSKPEKVHAGVSFAMKQGWLPDHGIIDGVSYENTEQYLNLKLACCVADIRVVGGRNDFLDRISGRLSDYVLIPRTPPTPNATGELVIAVSNCGRGWDWTD